VIYSQDWGTTGTPAALLLNDHFPTIYPDGVEVGIIGGGGSSMVFTTVDAVIDYLPSSGPAGPLDNDQLNPTSTSSGIFGGAILSLKFDVEFSDAGHLTHLPGTAFGNLVLVNMSHVAVSPTSRWI